MLIHLDRTDYAEGTVSAGRVLEGSETLPQTARPGEEIDYPKPVHRRADRLS